MKHNSSQKQPARANSGGWKEHPVIVSVLSGAAAVTFMVTIVFPILTSLQNQKVQVLAANNKALESEVTNLKGRLASASDSLSGAAKSFAVLGVELQALRLGAMFDGVNSLPYGWRRVQFGAQLADIQREYADRKLETKEKWINVSGDGAPFGEATFYTSPEDGFRFLRLSHHHYYKQRLEGVDIELDRIRDNTEVVNLKIRESFGPPDLTSGSTLCWIERKGVDIVHDPTGTLFFPAGVYVLKDCGGEEEVLLARLKAFGCPAPQSPSKSLVIPT